MLTADHGVAPAPEFASSVGLDGSRIDTVKLMGDLVEKLSARFGTSKVLQTPKIVEGNIYFNHELLRDQKIAPAEVAGFIRDWALATGYFQACYSREQILDGRTPGEIGERVRNGFHAERSGDVVLLFKPFYPPRGQRRKTGPRTTPLILTIRAFRWLFMAPLLSLGAVCG